MQTLNRDLAIHYLVLLLLAILVWTISIAHYRLNSVPVQRDAASTGKATAYTMASVVALSFFLHSAELSRSFVILEGCLLFFMAFALQISFERFLQTGTARHGKPHTIAILGEEAHARELAIRIRANTPVNLAAPIFIALPGQAESNSDFGWEELHSVVETNLCDELILALPPQRISELPNLLKVLRDLCVPARVALGFSQDLFVSNRLKNVWGLPVLNASDYPIDTIPYLIGKRAFDLLFSLAALILFAPLMVAIAAAVKLTSPGPILFPQERIGLNGRRFKMLKFRTMVTNAGCNTLHTSVNDPRITRIGAFLRRTSLDELPQFINVLKGEMSVVGPRPELTHFVKKFRNEIPSYMARHNAKCGITGWAQINGLRGSETSIPRRIEYDLDYLRRWSMGWDLKIIALTILTGFAGKKAF